MVKERTQIRTTKSFANALNVAAKIASPVIPQCVYSYESFDENVFHPTVASKIVGLSFLSVVAAWEEFIEESFLRYMSGALSPSGFSPEPLIGRCRNRTHSMRVLTASFGETMGARNLRWHDFEWVQHLARVFFRNGAPYSRVDSRLVQWLKNAIILRNRVAHNSKKARAAFKRLANQYLGAPQDAPLPSGFSPGQLLVSLNGTDDDRALIPEEFRFDWDTLFDAYLNVFHYLSQFVTPFPSENLR